MGRRAQSTMNLTKNTTVTVNILSIDAEQGHDGQWTDCGSSVDTYLGNVIEVLGEDQVKVYFNDETALFTKMEKIERDSHGKALNHVDVWWADISDGAYLTFNKTAMNTYEIPVLWEACGYVRVEAENLEQAIELAKDCDLPDDQDYIDGSFEVNVDCMADFEPDYWIIK